MPQHEEKRVTLTLTAVVSGSGDPVDFISAVAARVKRELPATGWSHPEQPLNAVNEPSRTLQVRDVRLTEVHLESR